MSIRVELGSGKIRNCRDRPGFRDSLSHAVQEEFELDLDGSRKLFKYKLREPQENLFVISLQFSYEIV